MAEAAAQPADAGGGEGEDALGDAGRVHDVAHQDEQAARRGSGRSWRTARSSAARWSADRPPSQTKARRRGPWRRRAARRPAWRRARRRTIWNMSAVIAARPPVGAVAARRREQVRAIGRAAWQDHREAGDEDRHVERAPPRAARLTDVDVEVALDQAEAVADQEHEAEDGDERAGSRPRPSAGAAGAAGRGATVMRMWLRAVAGEDPADEGEPDHQVAGELVRPDERAG